MITVEHSTALGHSMMSYQGVRIGKEKVKNSNNFDIIFMQIIAILLYLFTSQLDFVRMFLNLLIKETILEANLDITEIKTLIDYISTS